MQNNFFLFVIKLRSCCGGDEGEGCKILTLLNFVVAKEMEAWRDEWMDVVCGQFCVMGKFELPLSSI